MIHRTVASAIAATLLFAAISEPDAASPQASAPGVDELIAWLDTRETEWIATAHLQAMPLAALPLLLQPGRVTSGPHDRWTAHQLALAKLGIPAIRAITARVMAIVGSDPQAVPAAHPLIKVLGAMGPAAIPALVQIAESSEAAYVTFDALDEVVRLEPAAYAFGQDRSAWDVWRPADDRLSALQGQLEPLIPRIRHVTERAVRQWKPGFTPAQRPAAYLLARWGTGEARARGMQVLEDLARADDWLATWLLNALPAPRAAALIRLAATTVRQGELRGATLLIMARRLHQLGDPGYVTLLDVPLHDGRPDVRMDTARFIASTGALSSAMLLVPLLDDRTPENGRTVATVAHESLQRLTLQQFPPDAKLWREWLEQNRQTSRRNLVARRATAQDTAIRTVPIWEANRWIDEFAPVDGSIIFPVIDEYLRRPDLVARATGPNSFHGMREPRIVTLLLEMSQQRVAGALDRLVASLEAADPEVRMFGARALAAYDRPRALERLAREADASEAWHRNRASEFLLQLGDKRGMPGRLETLNNDYEPIRMYACRDLRVYSQQPLPCDAGAAPAQRAANVAAWRAWWSANERGFQVRSREAGLDLAAFPPFSPVSIGGRPVR